ncbi:MAG: glycosyltransferase family 2 protein [Candidatus Acidiferrales bacterium]
MTKLGLRPYHIGDDPAPGSVPVSVVILSRDEEQNIRRCLASVAWADQVVVIDSGSADDTMPIARSLGAEVVEQPWLGFSEQRNFALRLSLIRHDWIQFVDADQWVSPQLAAEIAVLLQKPKCVAYSHRYRLVFQGTWIRHCGWYNGSWNVQIMDRRYAKYDGNLVGERVCVNGEVHRLDNDIVDDDLKGLAAWLHKHINYAQLEAVRRRRPTVLRQRLRALRERDNVRPLARVIMKDILFPSIPAKPVALFAYMYFFRLGFLDGRAGLRFCSYHAWHEFSVAAMQRTLRQPSEGAWQ